MENHDELTREICAYCTNIGADLVGFTDPSICEQYSPNSQPNLFLPGTRSIILLGLHLYDIVLDTWSQPSGSGKGYQFADQILEAMGHRVVAFLAGWNFKAAVVPYHEMCLKEIGALGGMGQIGKNNLLLTPQYGPQVRLRAVVTDAPLICGDPIFDSEYCMDCQRCVDACPAGALREGIYKVEKCYPYQRSHLRKLSPQTSIWCNQCIEACPIGKQGY